MEKYDLIIVGAGPAGIFTAVELLRHGSKKKMLLVEKGKPVEKRHCPKAEVGHCVNCRPTCAITTGFSGAGAFSDGKLSLSYEVGGDLPTLIGEEFAQELIDYTDKIYLEFGADPHVEGIYTGEEIKEIRKNAIHAGLKLVDCPIRHLGTEKAQQLYLAIQNYLADNGVEMLFSTECENIILEDEVCKGAPWPPECLWASAQWQAKHLTRRPHRPLPGRQSPAAWCWRQGPRPGVRPCRPRQSARRSRFPAPRAQTWPPRPGCGVR